MRMAPCSSTVIMRRPSGLQVAIVTWSGWARTNFWGPVVPSQTRAVLGWVPSCVEITLPRMERPSGLHPSMESSWSGSSCFPAAHVVIGTGVFGVLTTAGAGVAAGLVVAARVAVACALGVAATCAAGALVAGAAVG